MFCKNRITLIGFIGKDAETRFTPNGTAHTDPTSRVNPMPSRLISFAKFSRISSGCPVFTTYSVRNFPATRVRFGSRLPSTTSVSYRTGPSAPS